MIFNQFLWEFEMSFFFFSPLIRQLNITPVFFRSVLPWPFWGWGIGEGSGRETSFRLKVLYFFFFNLKFRFIVWITRACSIRKKAFLRRKSKNKALLLMFSISYIRFSSLIFKHLENKQMPKTFAHANLVRLFWNQHLCKYLLC